MPGGTFHVFIVDTDNVKSVVSVVKSKSQNSDTVITPTQVVTSSITGHKPSILQRSNLSISDDKCSIVNCEFLIIELGSTTLGVVQGQLPLCDNWKCFL